MNIVNAHLKLVYKFRQTASCCWFKFRAAKTVFFSGSLFIWFIFIFELLIGAQKGGIIMCMERGQKNWNELSRYSVLACSARFVFSTNLFRRHTVSDRKLLLLFPRPPSNERVLINSLGMKSKLQKDCIQNYDLTQLPLSSAIHN